MIALMFYFAIAYPVLFFTSTFVGILAFSSLQALFYAKKHEVSEAFWAYPYSIFYTFTLFWITPYAIVTAGRSGWLTRGLQQQEQGTERLIFAAQNPETSKAA